MPNRQNIPLNIPLNALRPNNWYINRVKLERIQQAWDRGEQATLPPVLVTRIDKEFSLIDGNTRALAAHLNGATHIVAQHKPLSEFEESTALYVYIHREGPSRGVWTVADLESRVVEPEEHERLWIGFCQGGSIQVQRKDPRRGAR